MDLDESQKHATAALFVLALYSTCIQTGTIEVEEEWGTAATRACASDTDPEHNSNTQDVNSQFTDVCPGSSASSSAPLGLCLCLMKELELNPGMCTVHPHPSPTSVAACLTTASPCDISVATVSSVVTANSDTHVTDSYLTCTAI